MAFADVAIVVGSAVGLEGTAAAIGGGAILGAGAGGLYGAVTGDGNIGKDMLIGATLGGAGAYGAGAMGWGGEAADAAFGINAAPAAEAGIPGATGVTGPGGTVPGAVGAGPAPTAFNPAAASAASTAGTPTLGAGYTGSTLGGATLNGLGSQAAADTSAQLGGTAYGGGVAGGGSGYLSGAGTGGSSLTNGMAAAGAWMERNPIMTGLGLYTAASAAGLGKSPGVQLPPGATPTQVDTSYFKLNPSTFQPNRPQPVSGPVKPGVTPPYPDYVKNPYQPTGYASGGIASYRNSNYQDLKDRYAEIQEYEDMISPKRVNTEDPSWIKDVGVVTDTDPNTKNLSPFDKAKYQLAKSYARAGAPTSAGIGLNQQTSPYGTVNTDPLSVQQQQQQTQNAASGGIMGYSLGGYAHGGNPRLLRGPGDGMSDDIPATIGQRQPARLADGEFVVPADVVSHLGNGSTEAGAKKLHGMMDKVRLAKTGKKKQAPQLKTDKFIPT